MFTIKTISILSGQMYEVTCINVALANEVYQAALRNECTPEQEEDGDPRTVNVYNAAEWELDNIIRDARNAWDAAMMPCYEVREEMRMAA
jgi:hypothetical protein